MPSIVVESSSQPNWSGLPVLWINGKLPSFVYHLASQLNASFVLVYLQVKRLLVKAAWSILFLERRFYPIPINAVHPPYVNWSLGTNAGWWCTLKTRIIQKQNSQLRKSYLRSQQNLSATLIRSFHMFMWRMTAEIRVQLSKRSSFFGRTVFCR